MPLTGQKNIAQFQQRSGKAGTKRDAGENEEDVGMDDDIDLIRTNFREGKALIKVASAAVDLQPLLAPHGKKGAAWQEHHFPASVQDKVAGLIAFKKNPAENKQLANIIGKGLQRVSIGRCSSALRHSTTRRRASQTTLRRRSRRRTKIAKAAKPFAGLYEDLQKARARAATPSSDSDNTDAEPVAASARASRATEASSSIETLDSDDDDASNASEARNVKRRRCNNPSTSSDTSEFLALMKAENERRAKHDERIEQSFQPFVGNCSKQKDEYISLHRWRS
ncbi:hypothetical protein B0H13DRAFT_1911296 [Mycena leptocephala]|nr:hypothetical protein B0H13DRAFT_1911296 [Mycena leptocephala]